MVRGGLGEAGRVVHETGGDVLVHIQEDGAGRGGDRCRELHPIGHGHDVDEPGPSGGGREGRGKGESVEGEAVSPCEPGGDGAADTNGNGRGKVADDVANSGRAIGRALQAGEGETGAKSGQSDHGRSQSDGAGDGRAEVHGKDLLSGLHTEDYGNKGGEGLVGELGEVLHEVGARGDSNSHEDHGSPDAYPCVSAEEGHAIGCAGGVEDGGVGHHRASGGKNREGLARGDSVEHATDGGGHDHLSRAEHTVGGAGEHGTEGDGGG